MILSWPPGSLEPCILALPAVQGPDGVRYERLVVTRSASLPEVGPTEFDFRHGKDSPPEVVRLQWPGLTPGAPYGEGVLPFV